MEMTSAYLTLDKELQPRGDGLPPENA